MAYGGLSLAYSKALELEQKLSCLCDWRAACVLTIVPITLVNDYQGEAILLSR